MKPILTMRRHFPCISTFLLFFCLIWLMTISLHDSTNEDEAARIYIAQLLSNNEKDVREDCLLVNQSTVLDYSPPSHLPWQKMIEERVKDALLAGNLNKTLLNGPKTFVMGLASVWRKENYLQKTLQSLLDESEDEERREAVIVIYLADQDDAKIQKQLTMIRSYFGEHLDSGFFLVIRSTSEIYPPMKAAVAKKTYGDPATRVLWRTKQVIDFAFLFTFTKSLARYHVVLEDDIVAAPQYISAIGDFIQSRNRSDWVALEFTEFLGIGLTFRTQDLPALNQLLFMFHGYHPVDVIMKQFAFLQGQPTTHIICKRAPSLFQHIGTRSTLKNKVQKMKDRTFGVGARKFKNKNPPATLSTSMKLYRDYFPWYAYKVTPGYFIATAKSGDTFDIVFESPQNISRIVILSGLARSFVVAKKFANTPIQQAVLEYSSAVSSTTTENEGGAPNFYKLEDFKHNLDLQKDILNVDRLRIVIKTQTKNPLIIREIQIFKQKIDHGLMSFFV